LSFHFPLFVGVLAHPHPGGVQIALLVVKPQAHTGLVALLLEGLHLVGVMVSVLVFGMIVPSRE
jgi:hypothetical protein